MCMTVAVQCVSRPSYNACHGRRTVSVYALKVEEKGAKVQAERKNPRGMPAGSLADCVFFRVSVLRKGYFPASLSKKVITSSQVLNSSLPNRMAVPRRFSSGVVSMK